MLEVMVKKVNKEETTVCTSLDVAEISNLFPTCSLQRSIDR